MANIVSYDIDIDDTAPQITYSPLIQSNETYSPNPLDGWILNFINGSGFNTSPGQIAVGQSAHITAKDGATMSIAFTGTGIQLYGFAIRSTFSVSLNQTDSPANLAASQLPSSVSGEEMGLLASFSGLPQGNHTVTLTTHTSPQNDSDIPLVVFDRAVITASTNLVNASLSTVVVDDNDFQYIGDWVAESFPDVLLGDDETVHLTESTGDQAVYTFQGVSVKVDGLVNATGGAYEVLLSSDANLVAERFELSSFSSFFTNTTLFYATGLDPTRKHNVTFTNTGNDTLALRNLQVSVVSGGVAPNVSAMTSPPRFSGVTIAAIAVAAVLAFVLLLGFIGLFLYNRRRRQRRAERPLMRHTSLTHTPVTPAPLTETVTFSRGVSIDPFSEEALIGDGNTVESDSGQDHGQKSPVILEVIPAPTVNRRRRSFFNGGLLRSPTPSASSPVSPITIPKRVMPPRFLDTPRHSPFKLDFSREGSIAGSVGPMPRTPLTMRTVNSRESPGTGTVRGPARDRDGHVSFLDIASSAASSIRQSSFSSRSRRSRTPSRLSNSNTPSLRTQSTPIQPPEEIQETNEDSGQSRIASTGVWSLSLTVEAPDNESEAAERHPYSSPNPARTDGPESPSDSLPLTVSDINFRVDEDDDTEYRASRQLPPHPPLPHPLPHTPLPSASLAGSFSQQFQQRHLRQQSSASTEPSQLQPAYVAQTSFGRRLLMARAQAQEASQNASTSTISEQRRHIRGFTRSRSLGFISFGRKDSNGNGNGRS